MDRAFRRPQIPISCGESSGCHIGGKIGGFGCGASGAEAIPLNLQPDQKSILEGASGEALALAMKTLVQYGEALGARRLVPIKSVHLAGTFGIAFFEAYCLVIERLVADGVRVKVPTTTNPLPGRRRNLVNRLVFSKQQRLERALEKLGATPSYSCVPYDGANVPSFGDLLAWSESSAVLYANSVIGARTNRNSLLIDISSAVTGLTPEFGYLLDQHRLGQVLVNLDIDRMDTGALGLIVGQRLVNRVPVFEHYDFSLADLKNLGASIAASSAIDIFHVERLTPEAPDIETAFGGNSYDTLTITQSDLDGLREMSSQEQDLVVFGCPQMTLEETLDLSHRFAGERVRCPTWFCLTPDVAEQFREMDAYRAVRDAGVEIHSWCPLAALSVRLNPKRVLTSSGKLFYYLKGSEYGNLGDCLNTCGVKP